MTAAELLAYHDWLMTALAADPVLALASTTVWLDPLWVFDDDWFDRQPDLDDPEDLLEFGLHVSRGCFPELYVTAVSQLHDGVRAASVVQEIVSGIAATGIPLDDAEQLWYGIPIPGCGTRLADPDWLADRADLIPLLELFGGQVKEDDYSLTIPDDAEDVGLMLVASLSDVEDDARLQDLAALLAWLWGASGNSAVDWDDDMIAEAPPLDWTPENVALACDIITEANDLLAQAARSLERLPTDAELLDTLRRNITIAREKLNERNAYHVLRNSHNNPNPFGLVWPAAGESHRRTTQPGAELLQLRHHAEEAHG